jgi:methylenetetrahydrofolate reductase (NADPH)
MMAARAVTTPVIPGLRIISNVRQAARMAAMSGAPVPVELLERLDAAVGDPGTGRRIGVEHTLHVCRRLLDRARDCASTR